MANIKIGHVELTIDPDSLVITDFKNNSVVPAIRGGTPQAIPVGSSNYDIQFSVVFPNQSDINLKLRPILALHSGMPFVNVQSDLLATIYLKSLQKEETLKALYDEVIKQEQVKSEILGDSLERTKSLLAVTIASTVFYPSFVYAATRDHCVNGIKSLLEERDNAGQTFMEYILSLEPSAAARGILQDIRRYYIAAIREYNRNIFDKNPCSIVDTDTLEEMITNFIICATSEIAAANGDTPGILDAARRSPESIQEEDLSTADIKDGDSIVLLDNEELRIVGIDAYETTHDEGAGQEWYDRSATLFEESIAVAATRFWDGVENVLVKRWGKGFYGRTLAEIFSGDSNLNRQSALEGHTFPMAIANAGAAGLKDKVYVDAGLEAAEAGRLVWNPQYAMPDIYISGYDAETGVARESFSGEQRSIILPKDFRDIKNKSSIETYKIPLSEVTTIAGGAASGTLKYAYDIADVEFRIANTGSSAATVQLRILTGVDYTNFINNHFYFYSEQRNAGAFASIDALYRTGAEGYANTFNAILGPEDLSDYGKPLTPYTHIHLYAIFSSVPKGRNVIEYKNSLGNWVAVSKSTDVVASQAIAARASTIIKTKRALDTVNTAIKFSTPNNYHNDRQFEKIRSILASYRKADNVSELRKELDLKDHTKDSAIRVVAERFFDDWVPMTFKNISVSTIPNMPEALHCTFSFGFFNHLPYTPKFQYILTTEGSSAMTTSISALSRKYDMGEVDLARTPVVVNWLEKTYLDENADPRQRFSLYNTEGTRDAPMVFSYSYPILAYTTQQDIEKSSFTKTTQSIELKMYPEREIFNPHEDDLYDIIVEDVNYYATNNIRNIPLQSAEIPTAQFLGKGNSYMSITFSTNNLRSIEGLRKIDKIMQEISRSTFHEIYPVKVQVLHPLANLFGSKTFILQSTGISNKPGATGWFTIKMNFVESGGGNFHKESLELIPGVNSFDASNQKQEDVVRTLMDILFDDVAHKAVSSRLWRMLIGPTSQFTTFEDAGKIKEIPILLQYMNPNEGDFFEVKEHTTFYGDRDTGSESDQVGIVEGKGHELFSKIKDKQIGTTSNALNALELGLVKGCPIYNTIEALQPFDERTEEYRSWNGFMKLLQFAGVIGYRTSKLSLFKTTPDQFVTDFNESVRSLDAEYIGVRVPLKDDLNSTAFLSNSRVNLLSDYVDDIFPANSLNPNIARKNIGLAGRYKTEGNQSTFINDRIALYFKENLNFSHLLLPRGFLNTDFNTRFTSGNLVAYSIYKISSLLYANRTSSRVRNTVETMLLSALQIEAYRLHVSAAIALLSIDDVSLENLYKGIQNRQTVYEDLSLPRYSDIYGKTGHSDADALTLIDASYRLYSEATKLEIPEITSDAERLRTAIRLGEDIPLVIMSLRRNGNKILDNIELSATSIFTKATAQKAILEGYTYSSKVAQERALARIQKVITLSEKVNSYLPRVKNVTREGGKSIYTEPENLLTYAEVGVPPPINKFGRRDINALARDGNDLMEAGWQYYTPYGVKGDQKQEIHFKKTSTPAYNQRQVVKMSEIRANQEKLHVDKKVPVEKSLLSITKGLDVYKRQIIHDKPRSLKDFSNSVYNAVADKISVKAKTREVAKNDSGLIVENAVDGTFKEKEVINPIDLTLRHVNEGDPFSDDYLSSITKLRRMHKGSRLYDMKKAYPNVQLYFLQENEEIFQNWSKFYRYDSIISISVVHEKEAVSSAIIELTNFSGLLTNEPNYSKIQINPRDVTEGEEVTTLLNSQQAYVLGEKGEMVSTGKLSESAIGDIIAFRLKPGIRIQVRAGYSSVDNENPVIFTGQVAEVEPGKIVRLIAQGYDYQLMRHLEDSWSGSYNAFPTIITDMLHYTEYFGKWEPYQYSAEWTSKDKKGNRESSSPDHLTATGWFRAEVYTGINDTCNDNLYNLKNHGTSPNILNPFNLVRGSSWYCNGPILENIYSMRRYVPNYAIAVKPYDERATLYFGPKEGTYIYTSRVTADMVKYNQLYGLRLSPFYSSQIARDTVYDPSISIDDIFYSDIISSDIAGSKPELLQVYKADSYYLYKVVYKNNSQNIFDAMDWLSNRDVARCFFRAWCSVIKSDVLEFNAKQDAYFEFFDKVLEKSGLTSSNREASILDAKKSIQDDLKMMRNFGFNKLLRTWFVKPTTIQDKTYLGVLDFMADRIVGSAKGTYGNTQFNGTPQFVAGVDFNDFMRSLQALPVPVSNALMSKITESNVDTNKLNLKLTIAEIGNNLKAIYRNIVKSMKDGVSEWEGRLPPKPFINHPRYIDRKDKYFLNLAISRILEPGNPFYLKEVNSPILYFAMIQGETSTNYEFVGYLTFKDLFMSRTRVQISAQSHSIAETLQEMMLKNFHIILSQSWSKVRTSIAPTRGEQMRASEDQREKDMIAPNRKPFRDYHVITDMDIINNDIVTSKAHMANSVTLWAPNSNSNAKDQESSLGAGDMTRTTCSFSPLLQDDIPAMAFDRNAAESAWFETKMYQVAMGYLGDYLREMYQGNLVVLGNPMVNPYDVVNLHDNTRDLNGNFEVKRVVHTYDSQTGFTTVITPHLITYVNEDVESTRVLQQSFLEFGTFAVAFGLVLTPVGLFASIGAFLTVAAGTALGYSAYVSNRDRGGAASSLLGISFPTISAVGHTSALFDSITGNESTVRRNPCRIQAMQYKGEPFVAGLEGFERNDWTNKQAEDIIASDYQLGKRGFVLTLKRGYAYYEKTVVQAVTDVQEVTDLIRN